MTPAPQLPEHAVLSLGDVLKLVNLGRSTLYQLISTGHFPPQVRLSARRVGWLASEVTAWVAERAKVRVHRCL